jgi:bifunctional UDP-N-acetylglucosamine pyrophosphorylase/glucosamine-1-phosphate N-acetyltransferase
MEMVITAIILAAGKGTRFKSETPKVLHKLLDLPMVFYPYEAVSKLNPAKVAFIIGHKKERVREVLKNLPKVEFFEQENPKGGTADAVLKAKPFLEKYPDSYVFILNGDAPLITSETLKAGLEKVERENLDGLIFTTELENPTGYGRIVRDRKGNVKEIVEEKDASAEQKAIREVNGGIYIFKAKPLLEALLEIKPSPVTGELYLTDVVKIFNEKGYKVDTYKAPAEELKGVNNRKELAEAEKILLNRKIEKLQLEGVTVRLPETVYISWETEIGRDTEVEPNVVIRGKTEIGEGCKIGTGAVLENAEISDGVQILSYSYISDSKIEKGAIVGPFARIRNNSELKEKAEVGCFVEVKSSKIGEKTKAKHLSYIGDTEIGKETNVGAGTVFANYDGINKYKTYVGNNVFIGSNSLIIAPRKLGDWSFVACGSVVNKDIPPKALAISRAPLKILENKNPILKKKKT